MSLQILGPFGFGLLLGSSGAGATPNPAIPGEYFSGEYYPPAYFTPFFASGSSTPTVVATPGGFFPEEFFPEAYFTPFFSEEGEIVTPDEPREIDFPLFCPDLADAGVAAGTAGRFPFTIVFEDMETAATCFVADDAISCIIWPGDAFASVATPLVDWVVAEEGTAVLTLVNSDTLGLTPGDYRIQVRVTASGQKYVVHDSTFRVGTSPGSATAPTVYCTFDMMEAIYSGLRTLQKEQSDEAGFLGLRKMARDTIDYVLYTRYRPRPQWNRRRGVSPDSSFGFDVPDRTTIPPTQAQLRQLLADDALVIDGPDGTVLREIAARLSVAYVLGRQETATPGRGYAAKSDEFRGKAMDMLCCYWAFIDTDGDGVADILINRDVTFLD